MKGLMNLVLLLPLFVFCHCAERIDSELKSVIVIFRHGERNILRTYPNDPYKNESFWSGGYGELITKGKMHHYLLGQWFRRRYDGFIPTEYNPDHIRIESTAVDRTLMSAGAHLSGLYPPPDYQKFDPALDWQPIPIHSKLRDEDAKLSATKPCPRYEELYNLNWKKVQEAHPDLKAKIDSVTKTIHEITGPGYITGIDDLVIMYDVFKIETEFGYKLPEWSKQIYPEPLTEIAKIRFILEVYTSELAKFKLGLLFKEFGDHFYNITDPQGKTYPKYRIYSAHDTTVANILYPLGLSDGNIPTYASALIFELRQDKITKDYFVNVLYKNSNEARPTELTIKDCDFDCRLEKFWETLAPMVVKDIDTWDAACQNTQYPKYLQKNTRTRTMLEFM